MTSFLRPGCSCVYVCVVAEMLADTQRPAVQTFFPPTCGSCHPLDLHLLMETWVENPESRLPPHPAPSHWPSLGDSGHWWSCSRQGRVVRRRAVQEHRGLGSLLVSSVASLCLPQFPRRPSGGVSAANSQSWQAGLVPSSTWSAQGLAFDKHLICGSCCCCGFAAAVL